MSKKVYTIFAAALLMLLVMPAWVLANEHSFELYVQESGYFNISVNYAAVLGGGDILQQIIVNNQEKDIVPFRRYFADENTYWRYQEGNQMFPFQIEETRFTNFVLAHNTARPVDFYMYAGINTVDILPVAGEVIINSIYLTPSTPLMTYEEYREYHINAEKSSTDMIVIQAQQALFKSSATLIPQNDRTDPLVQPYHPTYIVLNSIGGWPWRLDGQRIEWEVQIPESGMYRIAMRYAQRERRGFSSRILTINGKVPFVEAAYLRFDHGNGFSSRFLYNTETGEDFWFYFTEGTNIIGMEVTLGLFENISDEATQALIKLTQIYQDIIMVTSASPIRHRDYQILTHIPDLRERLLEQAYVLRSILEQIEAVDAGFAESTAIVQRLLMNIERIADRPDQVAILLVDFQVSIGALAQFVTSAQAQPLLIDTLGVGGYNAEGFVGRAGFFRRVWHNIMAFMGSFTNDLSFDIQAAAGVEPVNIEVWMSTGFDLFNILGRIINEQFVAAHPHINVDLRLVDAGIVFPASLTGQGPDVVLQSMAMTPINFAHRGGAVDLTRFADFEEVAGRFSYAAMRTFEFDGRIYALPDQMTFNVMYYRSDILEDLGMTVPNTMDELLAMLPTMQARFMDIFFTTAPQPVLGAQPAPGSTGGMIGAITRGVNPVHASILHQMGGTIFNENGSLTEISNAIGIEAFRYWTNLYTRHNFIVETDVITRFRLGEIPIAVADLGLFNAINASAPEIRGNWSIAPIPGIINQYDEFRRDNLLSVSGSFIVQNMVESRDNMYEAWEFLRWFSSDAVQARFAAEVEAVWGHNWRYSTANLSAFAGLPWQNDVWQVLQESLDWAFAIPQVPGGYVVGRETNNAFLATIIDNRNPTDALFIARDRINTELYAKRREFGLID